MLSMEASESSNNFVSLLLRIFSSLAAEAFDWGSKSLNLEKAEIIKDFLPEEEFKIIEEQIFNEDFPWFFNDGIVDKGDGNFQLTHLLYHKKAYTGMKNSAFFDTF